MFCCTLYGMGSVAIKMRFCLRINFLMCFRTIENVHTTMNKPSHNIRPNKINKLFTDSMYSIVKLSKNAMKKKQKKTKIEIDVN